MNDTEYYKELITYYITNYDFDKEMDLKKEQIKASLVETLQEMVDNLKDMAFKNTQKKMGKVIKLKIAN